MMLNKQRTFSGLVVQPAQKLIRLRKETSFLAFAINASAKKRKDAKPYDDDEEEEVEQNCYIFKYLLCCCSRLLHETHTDTQWIESNVRKWNI